MKKYELTDKTLEVDGRTLYQIKALKDFGSVTKGDVGGYIESEKNLSHEGLCWIYDDAWVSGNARVSGYARVYGNSIVTDDARVYGNDRVTDDLNQGELE